MSLPGQQQTARSGWQLGADILWVFALMVYVLAGTALVPFHADESTQIMMSRDYYYQFIVGDLDRVLYHDPPLDETEQHLRLLNGTLPKLLIGVAWQVGGYDVSDLNDQWLWGAGWDWNVENGHMPTDDLLLVTRWSAVILAALSIPAMFALGRLLSGRLGAYAASFLLAVHPVVLIHGRRAYMEAALLLFGLLVLLAAIAWGRRLRRPGVTRGTIWGGALLLALPTGLVVASKHSGVVIAAAAYLGLGIVILWQGRGQRGQALAALVVSGLVAVGLFVLLNPAWWDAPLSRPLEVLALRSQLVTDQSAAFPESVYPGMGARLGGLLHELTGAPPVYYEAPWWADFSAIQAQIAAYQASVWTGIQYGTNALTTILGWLQFGLMLIGVWPVWRALRQGRAAGVIVLLWAGLTVIFILATIPLAWQRYAMPLYPAQTLLAGAGLSWIVQAIRARRQPAPASAASLAG